MTKEEKQLLLRDLCARLPYGVICNVQDGKINKDYVLTDIHANGYGFDNKYGVFYGSESFVVKPYLRPRSSMTKEEMTEYFGNRMAPWAQNEFGESNTEAVMQYMIDFLLENHFDYRGLISKGLAIAVTEDNNPYK